MQSPTIFRRGSWPKVRKYAQERYPRSMNKGTRERLANLPRSGPKRDVFGLQAAPSCNYHGCPQIPQRQHPILDRHHRDFTPLQHFSFDLFGFDFASSDCVRSFDLHLSEHLCWPPSTTAHFRRRHHHSTSEYEHQTREGDGVASDMSTT